MQCPDRTPHSCQPIWQTVWQFVRSIFLKFKWQSIALFSICALVGITTPLSAYLFSTLIDKITATGQEGLIETVTPLMLLCLSVELLHFVLIRARHFIQGIFFVPYAITYAYNSAFEYVSKHSHRFFANNFAGALSTKISDISTNTHRVIQLSGDLILQISIVLFATSILFKVHYYIASIICVWILCHASFVLFRLKKWKDVWRRYSESNSRTVGGIVDSLTNYINVKLFAGGSYEREYVKSLTDDMIVKRRKASVLMTTDYLFLETLRLIAFISSTVTGIYLYAEDAITLGNLTFTIYGIISLYRSIYIVADILLEGSGIYGTIAQALTIINKPIEILDAANAKTLVVKKGEICLKNISFAYTHKANDDTNFEPLPQSHEAVSASVRVFDNLSLSVQPGEKVGLVGHSGAGKSTLIHLLLRYFDVQSGDILIDGQSISKITQDSLHQNIAMIPQDITLFHRTIMENIRYGKLTATDAEVKKAAKQAFAHDFIKALPHGYDSLVGERGVKLSVGQRQRVAIARAVLKDAPILILDEATSALDSETESIIQQSLAKLMEGRTTIVIAHRLSTLREMDRIIVLNKGQIIEEGSHLHLLRNKSTLYSRLWAMQSNGFLPRDEVAL